MSAARREEERALRAERTDESTSMLRNVIQDRITRSVKSFERATAEDGEFVKRFNEWLQGEIESTN